MTEHYKHIEPADEDLVARTFQGFVARTDRKGRPREHAIFHCERDAIPSIGAPYDLLRPLFRATGALTGGVGHHAQDGYQVTLASPAPVRSRIEEILAKRKSTQLAPDSPTNAR